MRRLNGTLARSKPMRSYTLLYSKIWKQVVSMIAVPVATIIPFILILTQYQNLSDTVAFIIIYAAFGIIILISLYVVFKQAMVPVKITIHDWGFEFFFKRKTLFNWQAKKDIAYSDIEFVSGDEDINNNSRKFFTIKVKNEWGKIILIAPRKTPPEEMEEFSLRFSNAVERFNQQNVSVITPIRRRSFYTGRFAKILSWIFIGAAVVATIIKIADPSRIEWYRMIWLYVLAASWLANIYTVKKKQKRKA